MLPTIGLQNSILEAMKVLDTDTRGIVLVVDEQGKLLNTITDGDIRRALMQGVTLDQSVDSLLALKGDRTPIVARLGTSTDDLISLMKSHVIRQLPILDHAGIVVNVVTWRDLMAEDAIPVKGVIMAGGFGNRLRPLTEDMPKPMLPVGDKPIMELIIDQLQSYGIRRLNVTTH